MVSVFGEFMDIAPDDFRRVVDVVFFGFANGTREALRRMLPRDRGHVIQVGSALAHRGIPLQSAYCASKHAIKSLSESVLLELRHRGSAVRISQVDMPAMNTTQFDWVKSLLPHHPQPVPPIYQPEICAAILADVADRPRRRTWVGESTVATVLGTRLSARLADAMTARSGFAQQDPSITTPCCRPICVSRSGVTTGRTARSTTVPWMRRRRPDCCATAGSPRASVPVPERASPSALAARRHPPSGALEPPVVERFDLAAGERAETVGAEACRHVDRVAAQVMDGDVPAALEDDHGRGPVSRASCRPRPRESSGPRSSARRRSTAMSESGSRSASAAFACGMP